MIVVDMDGSRFHICRTVTFCLVQLNRPGMVRGLSNRRALHGAFNCDSPTGVIHSMLVAFTEKFYTLGVRSIKLLYKTIIQNYYKNNLKKTVYNLFILVYNV